MFFFPDPVSSPEPSEESPNNGGDSTTYPSSEFESRLDLHRFQQFVSEERGRDAGGLPGAFVRNLEGRMPDANIPQPCVPAQRTGNAETRHLLEARNLAQADPSFMSQVSGVPEVAGGPTVMKSGTCILLEWIFWMSVQSQCKILWYFWLPQIALCCQTTT